MNSLKRNDINHFGLNPVMKSRRSILPLQFRHCTTFNTGKLVPIFVKEVLPGDTWSVDTNAVLRLTTSIHPTMDNLIADVYYFFVPNRIIWDDFTKFMGENDKAWAQDTSLFVPPYWNSASVSGSHVQPGSLLNHLGLPVGFDGVGSVDDGSRFNVTLLDFNSYLKIWNDWFRDENLQDEVPISTSSGWKDFSAYHNYYASFFNVDSSIYPYGVYPFSVDSCLPVNKFMDYFSSCLPQPQKGGDVLIPASGDIELNDNLSGGSIWVSSNGTGLGGDLFTNNNTASLGQTYVGNESAGTGTQAYYDPNGSLGFSGLEITVNNLRLAIKTQELLELDARGGTRINEILYSHFSVISPDARLQRSEYIGGSRFFINMSEVVQTSQTSGNNYLGDLAGRSLTIHKDNTAFTKSFTEWGHIIGVIAIRNKHEYGQGIEKRYRRFSRYDYYWRVLANIGEQPVYDFELYFNSGMSTKSVFGYNEAWADYRYHPDRLSGFFSPMQNYSLISWLYADYYTSVPYLSSQWLEQGKAEIDRTLTVPSSATVPQFIADFYFSGKVVREMPLFSIPGSTRL